MFLEGIQNEYLSSDYIADHVIVFGIMQIYFAPVIIGSIYL